MASVERTTFEIEGPVPNTNDDMIRTEWDFYWALIDRVQDIITNNHQRRIRLSPSLLVRLVLTTCFIIYLIAQLALNVGDLDIKTIDIQEMHVNINIIDNNTISLEGNTSLRVIFEKIGDIQPSPDLATFTLTISPSKDYSISVTSNSTFSIYENVHSIVVKFEHHQTHLSEEEIRHFQKRLKEDDLWVMFNIDFRWHLKKARLLVFPDPPKHIHLTCKISYRDLLINDTDMIRCNF